MTLTTDKTLQPRCRDLLSQELKLQDPQLLDALIAHLFGLPTPLSLGRCLEQVLHTGRPLSELLTAVQHCELLHLEAVLITARQQPRQETLAQFHQVFGHYASLQSRWLVLGEQRQRTLLEQLHRQLDQEREGRLKEWTKQTWLRSGRVALFNYFRELQVNALAPVHAVEGDTLTVEASPALDRVLAASPDKRSACTPIPENDLALLLERVRPPEGADYLTLRIVSLIPNPQGRRQYRRIRLQEPIPLELRGQHPRPLRATLVDLSEAGLGLAFDPGVTVEAGEAIRCSGTLKGPNQGLPLTARGTVRWAQTSEPASRAGIELALEPAAQEKLRNLLMAYEQAAIQALRQLA